MQQRSAKYLRPNSRYRRVVCIVLAGLMFLCLAYIARLYRQRAASRTQVYDLTWLDKTHENNIVYRRWRHFIEPRSRLPLRIEKYYKQGLNDNYTLLETLVIEYTSDDEIRQVISEHGF